MIVVGRMYAMMGVAMGASIGYAKQKNVKRTLDSFHISSKPTTSQIYESITIESVAGGIVWPFTVFEMCESSLFPRPPFISRFGKFGVVDVNGPIRYAVPMFKELVWHLGQETHYDFNRYVDNVGVPCDC